MGNVSGKQVMEGFGRQIKVFAYHLDKPVGDVVPFVLINAQ